MGSQDPVKYIALQLFSGEKENSKREEKIVWEYGKEEDKKDATIEVMFVETRPSVIYAKDWPDQLFPFPGLVCLGEGFQLGCDH